MQLFLKYLCIVVANNKMQPNGLFAKKFRKVRDSIGVASVYTLMGMRHTRIIHLKQDGATDADIMSLTGHKTYEALSKYLRDLGLDADAEKLNRISRKV